MSAAQGTIRSRTEELHRIKDSARSGPDPAATEGAANVALHRTDTTPGTGGGVPPLLRRTGWR